MNDEFVPLQPGEMVDHYEIWKFLGKGAMGRVYQAFDKQLNRWVAIKILHHAGDPERAQKMMIEARNQATVDHEHVCKVYETGVLRGFPYVVMQYIEGITLDRAVRLMSLREKVLAIQKIAEGLHKAHECGLIHRDIKPQNIMMERGDVAHVFLMDFGVAKQKTAPSNTIEGEVKGSPAYMSPEQAEGRVDLDHTSDIYNLGATLYFLLVGRAPFSGDNTVEVLLDVMEKEPEPIGRVQPDLPQDLQNITMKCIQKEPENRYQSALALASDLGRLLANEPVTATPATPLYLIYKFIQKNRYPVLATFLVLLSLVAGLLGTTAAMLRAYQAADEAAASRQEASAESQKAVTILNFVEDLVVDFEAASPWEQSPSISVAIPLEPREIVERIEIEFDRHPRIQAAVAVLVGKKLLNESRTTDAVYLLDFGCSLLERNYGPWHPRTLRTRLELCVALVRDRKPEQAVEQADQLLKQGRLVFGEDHPMTMAIRELWLYLQLDGRSEDEEPAAVYAAYRRLVEGELLLPANFRWRFLEGRRRAVYEAVVAQGSPSSAIHREFMLNFLALRLTAGDYRDVLRDLRAVSGHVADVRRESPIHELSLHLWEGRIRARLGQFPQALSLFEKIHLASEERDVEAHILALRARNEMVDAWIWVGDAEAALQLAETAEGAAPEPEYAFEHFWRGVLRGKIAIAQNKPEEARLWLERSRSAVRQFGGGFQLRALELEALWAEWLRTQYRFEEAAVVVGYAYRAATFYFEPENRLCLRLQLLRGRLYMDQKLMLGAEPLLIACYETFARQFGNDHPATREAIQTILFLYDQTQNQNKREVFQERLTL
ncbi:serine/threonine-protein kinase [Acanthopleuribacter pedis]|uniref:Serine/threonine protein kinase n=1 Tax=Acanthopleuribacter pedis TaxID=442870 RepID=A0A8J7Q3R1_9BACT|nr:serine/threonine-protein kinase [Acanthopleuribacter pedis]MBO1320017.1 serine/threonine protein kinase [Acanthopleuribacter pedis]